MLFNSLDFAVFLILVLTVYFVVLPARLQRTRKGFLLIASYAFYGSWNPPFTVLLLISTALDYTVALRMERTPAPRARRLLLLLSLCGNLGMLGFFKYGDFLLDNLYALAGLVGGPATRPSMGIFLPIGISFYTFQTLSYSLDVYRGRIAATHNLLDFALYVSFFPQLVAGPIVRARDFLPQLERPLRSRTEDFEYGAMRIAVGLVKKVVLADTLGAYVDVIYAHPGDYFGWNILLAIYAYAYQIYFDFSGYSDIAIGLGRLFGLRIPENFDRPYLADSMRDFWRRWHITLSTWLRDYLYVSLGGNRDGVWRTYRNLSITMLLGGLWHGASWNFVIWGGYHGVLLALERAVRASRFARFIPTSTVVRQVITFHLVCVGWIFFRAQTVGDVATLLGNLFVGDFVTWRVASQALLALALAIGIHIAMRPAHWQARFRGFSPWAQGAGYALCAVSVFLFSEAAERFIYFQF